MAILYADLIRPDILRMIPPDGQVIGSIGCGAAATEAQLVLSGRTVYGVDISHDAIEVAKTRLSSARVISADERSPFADDSLDGLILADVIEHIPQAWDALRLFSRAVKPGGWVVISVPNMRYVVAAARFGIGGDWPEHPSGIFDATHLQVMSKKRLDRWCVQAGLRVETWFDRYDPNNTARRRLFKFLDAVTLHLLHSWFMFQLQVLCRREIQSERV